MDRLLSELRKSLKERKFFIRDKSKNNDDPDLKNLQSDWIGKQTELLSASSVGKVEFRAAMMEIAALAIAAIEAYDVGGRCNPIYSPIHSTKKVKT